jgi:polyisoprenyl-phosphate glycosyltransferase
MSDYETRQLPRLGIVLPCYNEQEILPISLEKITALLGDLMERKLIREGSFAACIDDGSKDVSWEIIEKNVHSNPLLRGLKLAGNVGHQGAILAGMLTFKPEADIIITLDIDLQDDIRAIEKMIALYKEGHDIVYGVRSNRDVDSFAKNLTARFFYRFMKWLGVNSVYNHGDFRLASRRVIDALEQYDETNLYLRGIFPAMGFNAGSVYYDRLERVAGASKYPFRKSFSLAWEGITSFSVQPLKLVTMLGMIVFGISIVLSLYSIISYLSGLALQGWISTVLPMYFLGGIQLLCIGIIGEYIGKIYKEVKGRPRFIVDRKIGTPL